MCLASWHWKCSREKSQRGLAADSLDRKSSSGVRPERHKTPSVGWFPSLSHFPSPSPSLIPVWPRGDFCDCKKLTKNVLFGKINIFCERKTIPHQQYPRTWHPLVGWTWLDARCPSFPLKLDREEKIWWKVYELRAERDHASNSITSQTDWT